MKRLLRRDLISIVTDFISDNYRILSEKDLADGCHSFFIDRNGKPFELTVFLKNISSAYLSYDPTVDRIQVPPIPSIHKTETDKAFLLMGIKENALVAWNPQRYTHHDKYRSAYVFQENISRGISAGFYSTMDHENKIYVCTKGHFEELLEAYISDTFLEAFTWQ